MFLVVHWTARLFKLGCHRRQTVDRHWVATVARRWTGQRPQVDSIRQCFPPLGSGGYVKLVTARKPPALNYEVGSGASRLTSFSDSRFTLLHWQLL
jgi:hypothetical protein